MTCCHVLLSGLRSVASDLHTQLGKLCPLLIYMCCFVNRQLQHIASCCHLAGCQAWPVLLTMQDTWDPWLAREEAVRKDSLRSELLMPLACIASMRAGNGRSENSTWDPWLASEEAVRRELLRSELLMPMLCPKGSGWGPEGLLSPSALTLAPGRATVLGTGAAPNVNLLSAFADLARPVMQDTLSEGTGGVTLPRFPATDILPGKYLTRQATGAGVKRGS